MFHDIKVTLSNWENIFKEKSKKGITSNFFSIGLILSSKIDKNRVPFITEIRKKSIVFTLGFTISKSCPSKKNT
ncbi:hypothetical protein GCM10022396_09580 [Flavivirga amylovorans]